MANLTQVTIRWKGSFQCRLATDPAPSGASPAGPGPVDPFSNGWTLTFGEAKFDRLIRLVDPVQLRTALVEPWTPVKVSEVKLQFAGGIIKTDNAMKGAIVSYGRSFFEGPRGLEELRGLSLRIGLGPMYDFFGVPRVAAKLTGVTSDPSRTKAMYGMAKASKISKVTNATRRSLLESEIWINWYASIYAFKEETKLVDLKDLRGTALFDGNPVGALDWSFKTSFSGYDGDTLVGHVEGHVIGRPTG